MADKPWEAYGSTTQGPWDDYQDSVPSFPSYVNSTRPPSGLSDANGAYVPSKFESGVGGGADASQFGFQDELLGASEGLNALIHGRDPRYGYSYGRAKARAINEAQQAANPVSYGGGQIAGSLAIPMGEMKTLPQVATKMALAGGAHGFGSGDTLADRLMSGGTQAAGSAVVGSAFHGAFAPLLRPGASTSPAVGKLAQFDQAGVRPTMAALAGPGSASPFLTKAIAENFFAGGHVRSALQNSLDDTAGAARNLASGYGTPATPELAGANIRAGVASWRQSFSQRADDLYTRTLGPLLGKSADAAQTRQVLGSIMRESGPADTQTAQFIIPSEVKDLAARLQNDDGKLTFDSLRALRTKIRTMQKANVISPTIPQANLERLEGALTQDIYTSAQQTGGPQALRRLQQADKFYALGQQRIKTALKPFLDEGGTDAQAYQRIIDLASAGKSQNTRALVALKQTLKPDEWRDVAASLIDNMGAVTKGNPNAAQQGAFSVEQFVTNYAKMSREGRGVLFGKVGGGNGPATQLQAELDNLAQVAGMQKGVEKVANHSGSGRSLQNITALGLLFGPTMPFVAAGMAGEAVTGAALTNPSFVRWIAQSSRPGQRVTAGALRQLALLAARDPALAPAYEAVSRQALALATARSPAPASPRQLQGSRPQ